VEEIKREIKYDNKRLTDWVEEGKKKEKNWKKKTGEERKREKERERAHGL